MIRLVSTAAALSLLMSVSAALSYRTCVSADGRVDDMYIPGCEGEGGCTMRRGETKAIHILFVPYRPVAAVTTLVHVKVGWFNFPVALNHPDACRSSLPCPLAAHTEYKYVFNITIDDDSPTFSGTIRWELTDDAGRDLVCAEFAGGIS